MAPEGPAGALACQVCGGIQMGLDHPPPEARICGMGTLAWAYAIAIRKRRRLPVYCFFFFFLVGGCGWGVEGWVVGVFGCFFWLWGVVFFLFFVVLLCFFFFFFLFFFFLVLFFLWGELRFRRDNYSRE